MGRTPIFVYGTLLRGQANHHLLEASEPGIPARTAPIFELVDLGAYPAMVPGGSAAVRGELYWVNEATKAALDRFEGRLYRRCSIPLDDGRQVEAYVFTGKNRAGRRSVTGGDWRSWCKLWVLTFAMASGLLGSAWAQAAKRRDGGPEAGRAAASASASASDGASTALDLEPAPALPLGTAVAPPPASAPVQEPVPEWAGAPVKMRDVRVFTVRIPWGGRTAEERARAAAQALQRVVEANEPANVRVEERGDVAIVYVGDRPIIQLGRDDALAAGDVSLSVHADSIASKIRDGLSFEEKRVSLLKTGLMLLGVLLSGIIAVFLLRRVGKLWRAMRAWLTEHPDRIPALRVQSIEVVRPSTLRLILSATARLLAILLQIGIGYGWLLFALYIFEPTRQYTGRLTEVVLTPLSGLISKVGTSLPVLAVAGLSIVALFVLLRFVGLFFDSAARGETSIAWVPPDLVGPTSFVVRLVIIVLFLVVAIPFVTGSENNALARIGLVALISIGLASTPLLASMCVGIAVIYGRSLQPGDFAHFGSHAGRIETVTLLEVRLRDGNGSQLRVPHLLSLFHPTRVFGRSRPVSAIVTITSKKPQPAVRELLLQTAAHVGTNPQLELVALDQDGARYCVTVQSELPDGPYRLHCAICDALIDNSIPLGKA
ncbi:MAG TPA: gamma-glutamylcyclotransferase [Polyangiaceae bacterium]